MAEQIRVSQTVERDADVVTARQQGRQAALKLGFGRPEQALIATAISELARNIINYAGRGRVEIESVVHNGRTGLRVVASDNGPGIANIAAALTDGFSTGNSLGLGLPGTRRIVDEFDLRSEAGQGVTVRVVKWLR